MHQKTIKCFLNFLNRYKYEFIIMVFAFVYLYPILKSGFVNDDVFNALAHGASVNRGVSVWNLIAENEYSWFVSGRVFPLGPFITLLFDALALTANMSFYYKLYIVLLTLANIWLCGVLVEKITHAKRLKLFVMLVIPIFFQIAFISFNALYSFHGLVQSVMLFGLLSLICTISYFEKQKKRYVVSSAVFMACAMLLYEVGFMFIFAVILIALFRKDRSFWSRLRAIIPQLTVFLLIFLVNVYARMTADTSAYGGVEVHLSDMNAVFSTFVKQFSAAVPLSQVYFGRENISGALIFFNWRQLICLPIFAFMSYMIVFRMKKKEDQESNKSNLLTILIGSVFVIVPCLLISVSSRYQSEIDYGIGHLPVYAEWLGMALITAGLFSLIANAIKKKTPVFVLCIIIGLPILTVNICSMQGLFNALYPHAVVSREVYVDAIEDGFYDEMNDSNLLVYDNSTQFYALPHGDLFATYAGRKINTQDINAYKESLYGEEASAEPSGDEQTVFSPAKTDVYFTKELYYDADGGVILKGQLKSIGLNTESNVQSIYVDHVSVYVYNEKDMTSIKLIYNTEADNGEVVEKATKFTAEKGFKDGQIIKFTEQELIDVNSIRMG